MENTVVTIKNFGDGTERRIPVEFVSVTLEYRSLDTTAMDDERYIRFNMTPEEAIIMLTKIVEERSKS